MTEAAWPHAAIAAIAAAATGLLTWQVRYWLLRFAVLDRPNQRSSHVRPTPRGGGIAVMLVLLAVWWAIARAPGAAPGGAWLLGAACALSALSWLDDVKGLPALLRFAIQVLAVLLGLQALPGPVFQGLLPPWLDRAVAALAWLWFLNLYNFMDGIDGIAGVETAVIGLGVALIGGPWLSFHGTALAGAAAGFLAWNWHPARIFLGDVGSVGLGFLIGWLLLALAAEGHWAAALLLPLYHLADATLTLARRLLAGERVWQAHRTHFYQRAAPKPADHPRVSGAVAILGLALIALALWSERAPWPALALGGGLTALLLWWFGRGKTA